METQDILVACIDCGWSGIHRHGPIQGASCPSCSGVFIARRLDPSPTRDNDLQPDKAKGNSTMRAHYGEQAACRFCGADIQFTGKPAPRELVPASLERPAIVMTDGGWMDRGSGRFCQSYHSRQNRYDENGVLRVPAHRLHKPYRGEA